MLRAREPGRLRRARRKQRRACSSRSTRTLPRHWCQACSFYRLQARSRNADLTMKLQTLRIAPSKALCMMTCRMQRHQGPRVYASSCYISCCNSSWKAKEAAMANDSTAWSGCPKAQAAVVSRSLRRRCARMMRDIVCEAWAMQFRATSGPG